MKIKLYSSRTPINVTISILSHIFVKFCLHILLESTFEEMLKYLDGIIMKVFLGGTCNGSKWRDEIIKLLEIDYFNNRSKQPI